MSSNEFPKVTLTAPDGARAEIYHYGAHVTSWITPDGRERLFLSRATEFRPGVAMRGGVPIAFPQFSRNGSLPPHGIVRTITWDYLREETEPDGLVTAHFRLQDSEATRHLWDHGFQLDMAVSIGGPSLHMRLQVTNNDDHPFSFTAALHTYFRVQEIANVVVEGLGSQRYTQFGQNDVQTEPQLTIQGEVDRVYWNVPGSITLREGDQSLRINQDGFSDAVVWNPGKDKGDELTDLEPNGYRRMLCIEAVALRQPVSLEPTATWSGSQTITAMS